MRKELSAYIIVEESSASASKSFNSKHFSLLHFVSIIVLDKWNLLTAMNLVSQDIMAGDVANRSDREDLSVNLDFVAFHHLLNRGADVTHSCVDASMLSVQYISSTILNISSRQTYHNASIRSLPHSLQESVVPTIKRNRKRRVNNPPINMHPKIHL